MDTEPDGGYVTLELPALEAQIVFAAIQARDAEIERLKDIIASLDRARWVSVTDAMPQSGVTVLACYRNQLGKWRRIRAEWVAAKTVEASTESDIAEYDEETDAYYDPEGWYERIDNWDAYTSVSIYEGMITHWMPLPAPPNEARKGEGE